MDRTPYHRPPERPFGHNQTAPPPASHASPFLPPTAQPPIQIPFSDPFHHTHRDPFLAGGDRRGSVGLSSRAWPPPPPPGNGGDLLQQQQQHLHPQQSPVTHSISHSQPLPPPPPPPSNGPVMPSYDEMRRRSLGAAGSPPQYVRGPLEPLPPPPPSFPARNMPPPSPPQNAPSTSSHLGSAPRGPPTASPFAGVRDLGSNHHPGMSISAILGSLEERKPIGSPHSSYVAPASTPKSMQPPSPGRARSSSMREGSERGFRGSSPPPRGVFGEPAGTGPEPRRDGIFGSPQFRREPSSHSFRAFQHPPQEQSHIINGYGAPMRPNSQPVEAAGHRVIEQMGHREALPAESRAGTFRHFGEPPMPQRNDALQRHDRPPFQQNGITSHPQERAVFHSPQMDRERMAQPQGPMRFQPPGSFGTPMREDQASLFRPVYQQPTFHPAAETARESIEGRAQDMRRQLSRPSPPPNELPAYDRGRNGFPDRPATLEEHQRMDAIHREQQRKESDGSVHRALLNISPEFSRRGRNSPLPQAVQGAQPRHIGPGGDNPGIKMEFGRMFSGLGSGVGSVTPGPHHQQNGTTTPSRMSPPRHMESGDLVRPVAAELDERRGGSKAGSRAGKRNGRRPREDAEHIDGEGRNTPDAQRGNKRTKTNNAAHHHHHHVHPHHHHHHHHEQAEAAPGPFNMLRFPSNPLSHANLAANQAHHHHHHHGHPGHHHHHPPRTVPSPRKPSTTVLNKKVLDESASKPRKHLGSRLYTTEVTLPPAAETPTDSKIKFSSKMKPIPVFEGKENCTFTVRVPRYYLASSEAGPDDYSLEEICKRRQLWGTEVYTDDSDVVAAAVHSGWIKGDFGEYNEDLHDICDNSSEQEGDDEIPSSLMERPEKPVKVPEGVDAHITLLVLSPLESYASTNQHHVWSREWRKTHDGMSYMIHSIEFVDEGASSRFIERGASARKTRIALEEVNRREAAAGLVLFANSHGVGTVKVAA